MEPKVMVIFSSDNPNPQENLEGWSTFEASLFLINGLIPQIIKNNDLVGVGYVIEIIQLYLRPKSYNGFVIKTSNILQISS